MFATVAKADGFPISRRPGAGQPDLVVTWTAGDKAKAFLSSRGIDADYEVVPLTEAALTRMAAALGCTADDIGFDSYPE